MALFPIITAPDPRLKQKAEPIAHVDDAVRRLLDDMLATMYAAPGIGLAAPQVGVLKRAVVLDVADTPNESGGPKRALKLINPELVWVSDDDFKYEEGCLSLPEHYAEVERPHAIRLRHLDERGDTQELEAEGLLAVCIQHEMDHLDGILFVDRISAIRRNVILRKLLKAKKSKSLPDYAEISMRLASEA
ncbi:MAG TPA: peptide deformylase [Alphaproteobacteria bacterium]|nr:peptide deformylase [Alphaproteobacteria bacterium]